MEIIESSIEIKAPISLVWDILLDFENYHKWNKFTPKVECDLEIGHLVHLHVDMNQNKKIRVQTENLLWVKKEESIAWGITATFPVRTERAQILTDLGANTTRYYTYDKFWGILVPLVMFLYKSKIQAGFDSCAKNLKEYAEQQHQLMA